MSIGREEKQLLWRLSAICLGISLPLILLGKAVMIATLLVGTVLGLLATSGNSLRSSLRLVAESRLSKAIVAFFVTAAISTVFAIDPWRSLDQFGELALVGIVGVILFIVFREMPARYARFTLQNLCISIVIVMALCWLDALLGDPRLSNAIHGDKGGQLLRLNFMSSVLTVLVPLLWAWLMVKDQEQAKLAHWMAAPIVILSIWTVFLCGGRAGWMGIVAAGLVFLVCASRYHNFVLHARHWLIGIISVLVAPLFFGLAAGWDLMWSRITLTPIHEGDIGGGSGRLGIWRFASEHFFQNPFTGIGLENFRLLPPPEDVIIASQHHPHNFVIQILLELGFIGLAATLALIGIVMWRFYRYARHELYGLAGFAALVGFLTASLFNTSIFHSWWLTFIVFPLILAGRIGWSAKK